MRGRECVDRGLIRADPGALERIPGSLASAARFLRAAEKNVAIEEYEMAHPTTVRFISSGKETPCASGGRNCPLHNVFVSSSRSTVY
jgi:hypothetical protein